MIDQYPPSNGVLTSLIWRKTASGGETSLSGYDDASQALSYTPGQEQVYLNGILLVRGSDYTATNGTSITGLAALAASDYVQINCYNNFSIATLPTSSLTGTVSNAQLQNSSITINGSATSLGGTYTTPSASTSTAGLVQLTDSTSSTSTSTAATPNSVKSAYDLANGAIQKTLTTTTGDIIYASSANTPARLGIGSSSQVLTVSGGVPTWQTPAGGGGMTLLSTTTLSGVTTNISGISGSYKNLMIVHYNVQMNTYDATFWIQLNGANGGQYTGTYMTNQTAALYTNNGTFVAAQVSNIKSPNTTNVGVLNVYNYASSTAPKAYDWRDGYYNASNVYAADFWGGMFESNSAITSILFTARQSATFGGGTVLVYGVN